MTILSDRDIRAYLAGGVLHIDPLGPEAIRPASVDLRLGPALLIDTPDGHRTHHLIDDGPYRLHRPDFVLGATLERITIPNTLAGVLAGKSSRAREGLVLESAGYCDPGWDGALTVELTNLSPRPVVLTVGMWIGQIRFETLLSRCSRPYGSDASSHYQFSTGPVESRGAVGRQS